MTKNHKTVSIMTIVAAAMVIVVVFGYDLFLRGHAVDCDDGKRYAIDIRDFTTRYSAYSLEMEATLAEKGRVSAKLNPIQLQQLSDSLESANEFRKGVVAGYNACAISKTQYAQLLTRFQALDGLARQINQFLISASLDQEERAKLSSLVSEYEQIANKLAE